MITAYYELTCNGDGCTNAYPAPAEELTNPTAMWRSAEAAGWTRKAPNHYCPACNGIGELIALVTILAAARKTDDQIGAEIGDWPRYKVQKFREKFGIKAGNQGRPVGSTARGGEVNGHALLRHCIDRASA